MNIFAILQLKLENTISDLIPISIQKQKKVYIGTLAITFVSLLILSQKGSEIFPDDSLYQFTYDIELPSGTTLNQLETLTKDLQAKIRKDGDVLSVASVAGEESENRGQLIISISPSADADLVLNKIAKELHNIPDMKFSRRKKSLVNDEKPLIVYIFDENISSLKANATKVTNALSSMEWLRDVDASMKSDIPEISIALNKSQMNFYGLDANAVLSPLRLALNLQNAGVLQIAGNEFPIQVSFPKKYIQSAEDIKNMTSNIDENKKIYLSQIAKFTEHKVTGQIEHLNRKRCTSISANPSGVDLETAAKRLEKSLQATLGPDVQWKIGGQAESRKESNKNLLITVLLSIFLIFLLMASQFESLIQPVIVLVAVPLCLSGVAIFLTLWGLNISALVFVGFIILVGSSVNTSIVMVDFANQLWAEGKSRADAIRLATIQRLRPILVTTAANLFGHIPMAFAYGQEGAAMQRPLAVTLVGGLLSSTLLTLVVVPAVYVALTKDKK